MIQLPYFKFFPTEWLLGNISDFNYDLQGAFIQACCFYWRKECNFKKSTLEQKIGIDYTKQLIENNFIQIDKVGYIKILFLDEQHEERTESLNKLREAGRKGGLTTQKNKALINQSLSNDKAIKKDNKIKDNKIKELINKATKHPDPAKRISKEAATKVIQGQIDRGEL